MEKMILEQLVLQGKTHRQISSTLGCSENNVSYWLKKFGLQTAAAKVKSGPRECAICGELKEESFHVKDGKRRTKSRCKKCEYKLVLKFMQDNKKLAVEYKGGKCERCGYCKSVWALEFHHLNPSEKDPNWDTIKRRKFATITNELDKCILLCANCHAEEHEKLFLQKKLGLLE